MKCLIITISIFLYLNASIKCQNEELGGTREIYTWTLNTGTTFRLQALAPIWGHSFELATKYCNATLEDTTITVPSNYSLYLLGWDNVVLPCSQTNTYPYFGYSLYKMSIGEDRFVFYFDSRDCDYDGTYPCGNDFYFKYDYNNNSLLITIAEPCTSINAVNGEYYSIWEIKGKTSPITSSFQDFWQNCLVLIPSQTGNHSRLIWGPHPTFNATNYRIYRAVSNYPVKPVSLYYNLIQTVDSLTFEFTDYDVAILPGYQYAYYYVVGWNGTNESENTNYVSTPAEFHKEAVSELHYEYELTANYPNPFNPTTIISYQLLAEGLVILKVYDILGSEVAALVNEEKPAGRYDVKFDANKLSSGVYFYRIQAGSFAQTKNMMVLK